VLELAADLEAGPKGVLEGTLSFERVGSGRSSTELTGLSIEGTNDGARAEASRDGAVYANAVSALASIRQLEATRAYAAGDTTRAQTLIDDNLHEMTAVAQAAPAPERAMLERQLESYNEAKAGFARSAPSSSAGKARAKAAYAKDSSNLVRKKF
jgi:hypothetical protein